jgi:DNA-directed RNA polymerase subunit RPC12/RpoP
MRVVKAERWHHVQSTAAGERRCSVCGAGQLGPAGETVLDGETTRRYQLVRCQSCGYDLLEARVTVLTAAS